MSERPTTTKPGRSRPDRRWRRFRDLPIWSKLGVIMIVPTIATIVVGTNGLINSIDAASSADRARTLATLSQTSAELVHRLQDERAAAVMVLDPRVEGDEAEARSAVYVEAQAAVDGAERQFQTQSGTITGVPASFRELVVDIQGQLALLPQTRTRVTEGAAALTDTAAGYEELIVSLVGVRDATTQLAGDVELGDRMRAAAEISHAKESLSQLRAIGHEVLIRNIYQPHLRDAFISAQTGFDQSLEAFEAVGTGTEQAQLEEKLGGSVVRVSERYQFELHTLEGSQLDGLSFTPAEWDETLAGQADLLREVEVDLDGEIVTTATALRNDATGQLFQQTGLLLVALLLAILLAYLVARSMARSLRDLRQGALSVAQYGLPQAVARLRDPAVSTQHSPAEVAQQIAEPLPVRSKDEFGQVAEAFNAVHLEAVRTAAEQAQLRASVATMFVNLARRSQILVDRLINHLDRLERGEEDPDRLAELFQLDHLATRMRRNDENLLVLAGADSSRVQRDAAPLIDVLRAAQSEVEHYTRIEFGVVDRDLEVAAHAVNDLVHLIAELFDNASTFSPPESQVLVEARRVGDRAVLYVEDRGLGLSPEQLAEINERLATPPMVDVAVSRMMGLVVVSRLAARHGVKVELRPASRRGTIADVTLPASVLVPRGLGTRPAGRPEPPGELSAHGDGRQPEQRGLSARPYPASPIPMAPPPPFLPPVPQHLPLPPRDAPPPPPPPRMPALPARARGALPPWSDLTGASGAGHNGSSLPPGVPPAPPMPPSLPAPPPPPLSSSPLPRRRPGGGVDGDLPPQMGTDALIPRPRPSEPPGEQPSGDRRDRWSGERSPQPELPQPPPWPPIVPDTPTALPAGPASRPLGELPPAPSPRIPVPISDQTQELPIFRELESAWFRTRRRGPEPEESRTDETETAELAAVPVGGPLTDGGPGTAESGWPGSPEPGWRTAADDGWRAASSLAEMDVQDRTASGLPRRRPMAQLVPGGVERASTNAQRRSPEAVRGLLSAYHRGVQRGREQTIDGEPGGGTPPQSTEAGKERGT